MEEELILEGNENAVAAGIAGGILATFGIALIVCIIAWYVLRVIAYWKIFKKAGKPGWHSIIPFLNTWDSVDLSWNRSMAWVMLVLYIVILIMSGVNGSYDGQQVEANFGTMAAGILALVFVVLAVIDQFKLAKSFGKGTAFGFGLLFLNPIFKLILGFGDAKYQGPQG